MISTKSKLKPAIFLDRDGTLIKHVHHLCDAEQVELNNTATEAVSLLQQVDFACVVITNQSVVGRGMLSLDGLQAIHAKMENLLQEHGLNVDGIYYSTHVPQTSDLTKIEHFDRKPGPGMLLQAAEELGLAISQSWMIGDSISDIFAGVNAGCRGNCLIKSSLYRAEWEKYSEISLIANNLLEAAAYIVNSTSTLNSSKDNFGVVHHR